MCMYIYICIQSAACMGPSVYHMHHVSYPRGVHALGCTANIADCAAVVLYFVCVRVRENKADVG